MSRFCADQYRPPWTWLVPVRAMLFICPPVVWPYSGWTGPRTARIRWSPRSGCTRQVRVHAIVVVQAFNLEVVADGAQAAHGLPRPGLDAAVGRHAGSKERQVACFCILPTRGAYTRVNKLCWCSVAGVWSPSMGAHLRRYPAVVVVVAPVGFCIVMVTVLPRPRGRPLLSETVCR